MIKSPDRKMTDNQELSIIHLVYIDYTFIIQTEKVSEIKQIDKTFRYVYVKQNDTIINSDYLISISYLSSNILGHNMEYLICPQMRKIAHFENSIIKAKVFWRYINS